MAVFDAETAEPAEIELPATLGTRQLEILSDDVLRFLGVLHRRFEDQRQRLMKLRQSRHERFAGISVPKFQSTTEHIRDGDWEIAPWPSDLDDAAVILSGSADRRALIQGLNSGAPIYIADLADTTAHSWSAVIDAQINLLDRWDDRLESTDERSGKACRLNETTAVLMVRPRAWDLEEPKLRIAGTPISASLFDFGLYAFHTAHKAVAAGATPYFALAGLANSQEARLWDDVLRFAHEQLGLQPGTLRVLPGLETLTSVHEMDEILYEMRDHAVGLYLGATNLAVSYIATLRADSSRVLPDTIDLNCNGGFLNSSLRLMSQICARRRAKAFGGAVAALDIGANPNGARSPGIAVQQNHAADLDGIIVTNTDSLVAALDEVRTPSPAASSEDIMSADGIISAAELLGAPKGDLTEDGLRSSIRLGLSYLEAWRRGRGYTTIDGRVFNAADADLARAQVWQQLRHAARLSDGRVVDPGLVSVLIEDELFAIKNKVGPETYSRGCYPAVQKIFRSLVFSSDLEPSIMCILDGNSE
ncbi:MAG: hypothetical protein AAGD23_04225 [Pseudomonadota bacterium]